MICNMHFKDIKCVASVNKSHKKKKKKNKIYEKQKYND